MELRGRSYRTVAIAVAFTFCLAGIADAGARDHADGFFLRLSGGGGAVSTKLDDGVDELKLSGASGDVNIGIGAIVAPNLALHGTLFGWLVSDPDVELNNLEGSADGDLSVTAIGGGLTYYAMPVNLYFSGSLGFGSMSFDAGNVTVDTDTGVVVDLTIGKEWWVSDTWALGVAVALGIHSIPDGEIDERWTGTAFGLRFSATMN